VKQRTRSGYAIVDVLDRILDKGIMVDPCQRVQLKGIDVLSRKRRPAATSIQTYLRYEKVVKTKHLQSGSFTSKPPPRHLPANFFDLLDRILDKGIVVDSSQGIQFLGIDLLQIEARVVAASVQTYLHRDIARHRSAVAHHAGR